MADTTQDEDVKPDENGSTPDTGQPETRDEPLGEAGKRALEAERAARRKAEQQIAELRKAEQERQRRQAEEQGKWKELAEAEKQRADEVAQRLAEVETRQIVETAARRLRFRNTDEALALLPGTVDRSNSDAVSAALTELAADRPHLVAPQGPAPGAADQGPRDTGTPKLTIEQVRAMSEREINDRWDEVQQVLAKS